MQITQVTTERVREARHGFVAAANIEGDGLDPRAIALVVKFGDVAADAVTSLFATRGVRAVFRRMPQLGARLSIGYADHPLEPTTFAWLEPKDSPPFEPPPPRRDV